MNMKQKLQTADLALKAAKKTLIEARASYARVVAQNENLRNANERLEKELAATKSHLAKATRAQEFYRAQRDALFEATPF